MKITVYEMKNPAENTIHAVVDQEKVSSTTGPDIAAERLRSANFTDNIAQIASLVNGPSLRYFPDALLTGEQIKRKRFFIALDEGRRKKR